MNWIGVVGAIVALVIFWVVKTLLSKRMKFWRMVNKFPDLAFAFMMSNPETFAFEPGEDDVDRSIYRSGPFRFHYYVVYTIYANPTTLEDKQDEFVRMVSR